MEKENIRLSVGEFVSLTNQTLEYAYPSVEVEGEVSSFKVNQNKYVFFDLKDSEATVGCFMMVFALRLPIEDGMKVIVTATPKLTQWGKFSLTVRAIRPSGEGSLKKSFELLRAKLEKEGLFNEERKRPLPALPQHIAVISSTQAAGYQDFIKILGDRWGGMQIDVAHVQVQGDAAPDQIVRALRFINASETLPQAIVLIRGGGSADDLSAFNDELLVREIAMSRVPVLTGIGHEVDVSLADMVADKAASTPSNAAQLLVPDKREIIQQTRHLLRSIVPAMNQIVADYRSEYRQALEVMEQRYEYRHQQYKQELGALQRMVEQLNPRVVLAKGYSIVRGTAEIGKQIEIEQLTKRITAEVKHVESK